MINILKRYWFFLGIVLINLLLLPLKPDVGLNSVKISVNNLLQMLMVIPPIFIALGLLDVWAQRETMIRLMGEQSGLLGIAIAFLLGSAAAGPLYAAFPIAGVLLRKGSSLSNAIIFIGAWTTTKIPLLMFEASAMGWKFMLTRFIVDIPVIALIAYITERMITSKEKKHIYENIPV